MRFSGDITERIIAFLGCASWADRQDENACVLSNRRNKGLLLAVNRDKQFVKRRLNLEFFNSGSNDGLPSCLIRECVILRGLLSGGHPNVVPIESIECAAEPDIVELTYPFFPTSLRQFKNQGQGILSTELVRDLGLQLFRAVAFLHSKRVVHRNIRMENIMVDSGRCELKLTDFTQSKYFYSNQETFQEPRNRNNRPQTDRERSRLMYACPTNSSKGCDVWSSGVVLLELLHEEVPWSSSSSESEYIHRVSEAVGSFPCDENWTLPVAEKPDWIGIARARDSHLPNPTIWQKIRFDRGPHALLLVAKLLEPDSSKRISAQQALESAFLLGFPDDPSALDYSIDWFLASSPSPQNVSPVCASQYAVIWSGESRMKWIGSFLFQISRILECQTSRPVHTAVSLFHALPKPADSSRPAAALLAACLKICARFDSSKDMFKQISLSEISHSSDPPIPVQDILQSELFVLSNIDAVTDTFRSSAWDWVEYLCYQQPENLRLLAEYVSDLALMDSTICDEHTMQTIGIAAFIVAAQWLGLSATNLESLHLEVSIDALQIAVSRCISLISDRRASIILMDNGNTHKILKHIYKNIQITATVPSAWQTSRSYIESIIGGQQQRVRASPLRHTPPKIVRLRHSTLQHAREWAIESRRKRRSRGSSTPLVSSRSKRVCEETPKRPGHLSSN